MERQQRTISQVVGSYRDQLTNFVYETLNGSMDGLDLRRAHREMIRRLGPSAYIEGLREGGIPQEEMDADDKAAIQEWMTEQSLHVNQFAADAVAARGDEGKRSAILARVEMWVNAMQTIGGMGLMSAKKNQAGTWRLGATELHCKTCNGLNGKRHRLSWFSSRGLIPREPGSTTLMCKGYNCLCSISDDEGKRIL